MATIRQRAGIWQARVRRKGYPEESRSFTTKADAQIWARSVESSMDTGGHASVGKAHDLLLTSVLERYVHEVTPSKRGAQRETESIRFMQRHKMAAYSMANLTPSVIAGYRDERLKTVSAGTIIREICILSSVITHARKEWSLPIANPCALVRKPPSPQGRTRQITNEEEIKLLHELKPIKRRSTWMIPIVQLALETAMRRGELLALCWENVDLVAQTARLPMTKNGTTRIVPLSKKAVSIFSCISFDMI